MKKVLNYLVIAAFVLSSAMTGCKKENPEINQGNGSVPLELLGNWKNENGGQCDGFRIDWQPEIYEMKGHYFFQYLGGHDGWDISVLKNKVTISMEFGESPFVKGTFDFSISNGKMTITKATGDFEGWIGSSYIKLQTLPDCW